MPCVLLFRGCRGSSVPAFQTAGVENEHTITLGIKWRYPSVSALREFVEDLLHGLAHPALGLIHARNADAK